MRRKYLSLKYVEEFKCTGSDCPETCCGTEWSIVLDKKSAKSYFNSPNGKIRSHAKAFIQIINEEEKEFYAKVGGIDKGKGICGFCINGLCLIHEKMGEKGLCKTCYFYPKVINEINGQRELSIVLSCPEAAKIALLNESAMEFVEVERDLLEDKINIQTEVNLEEWFKTPKAEELFWGLRGLVIRLISDRRYTIDDRMTILGLFHRKLVGYLKEEQYEDVLKLIEQYHKLLNGDKEFDFSNMQIRYDLQLKLMNSLMALRESVVKSNDYRGYQDVLRMSREALEVEGSSVEEEYEKAVKEYEKHLEIIEPILENYIMNYLVQNMYPFSIHNVEGDLADYEESYMILMIHLLTLKLMIIGNCYYYKDRILPEHIVKVVYTNTRVTTHNSVYLRGITQELKNNGIYSVAWMTAIFKTLK